MWTQLITKRLNSSRSNGNSLAQWIRLAQCYERLPPKLPLILQSYESRKIRCGVILPNDSSDNLSRGAAFLITLLADVYSPDQAWFNAWRQRYQSKNGSPSALLVKYGDVFGKQSSTFSVPSPFLQKYNVEFLELSSKPSTLLQNNDGCHFYIKLQNCANSNASSSCWPTVNLRMSPQLHNLPLPLENQVDPQWALKATCGFINDKDTVNKYLEAMQRSNFGNIRKQLELKLQNFDNILKDLQISVLTNIADTERLYDQNKTLGSNKKQISNKIETWSQDAHEELQSKILPRLQKFAKKQLSIWKVYTYSESKLQLKLINMVTEPLRDLEMVNSLNRLKGELRVNGGGSNNFIDTKGINEGATKLHKEINSIVYQNFLLLQLPLILLGTFGCISSEFSSFSMGAFASFGIVLGFSRVLAMWQSLLDKYVVRIRETFRSNVENEKVNLLKEYETNFAAGGDEFKYKYEIIQSLLTSIINQK